MAGPAAKGNQQGAGISMRAGRIGPGGRGTAQRDVSKGTVKMHDMQADIESINQQEVP